MKKIATGIILFLFISLLSAQSLKVAAVQLEISDVTYSSYEQFKLKMEENVRISIETFQPDLIVFPEYTSVFPAVTPYYKYIENSESIVEVFYRIHEDNKNISSLYDLFMEESERVEKLLTFWGDLSRKYSVSIVGGSYFAATGDKLVNRLIVFGPGGNRIYEQDKFFLTEFETDIVNLSGGSSADQKGIVINGKKIVFTICRDTFLERWEAMYDDADLWVDIKANGEYFLEDQRALFSRALPARMRDSHVAYGVTVCLTGQFLELFWEGESSMIRSVDEDVHTFISSRHFRSNEILYFIVD